MSIFLSAFLVLSGLCAALSAILRKQNASAGVPLDSNATAAPASFKSFQSLYLVVFLLMNAGDWLQGPYVYALYQSYNYDTDAIAVLFVAGFLSSAVFGTVVGSFADTLGRKKLAIVYSVLYGLSCLSKLSPNFYVLLFGRVLAGIATSLLFSVFESWMVCEHNLRSFPSDLISQTFSWATWSNSLIAIASGVVANFIVDVFGLVSPFMLALILFAIGGLVVSKFWNENYGQERSENWFASLQSGIEACKKDMKILSIGAIQSFFESAMYSFVFIWTPTLQRGMTQQEALDLPFGWIFATFMVSIMIGSSLFGAAVAKASAEKIALYVYFIAAALMFVPIFFENVAFVFLSFILFEVCCGVHFPLIGTLRSRYIPEESRTAVLNLVRVPLNLIVVVVLLKVSSLSIPFVFGICATLLGLAGFFARNLEANALHPAL